jgi:hypothetical protein
MDRFKDIGTANASHCLPNPLALPKAFGTVGFAVFLGCGLTQSPGLPFSLRSNVFPIHWINPKPFKQTRRVCLAFLTLIRSIKQACFAASH